jgi:hypothetical protein
MRLGWVARAGGPRPVEVARRLRSDALRIVEAGRGRLVDEIVVGAEALSDALIALLRLSRGALHSDTVARRREMAARASRPLPILYDVHAEARQALARPLGLRSIPLDEICGSAVGGLAQRGGDFLPLREFRSHNWEARWQRVRDAVERLAVLPPIDVIKYSDCYWVNDGHNRVAAALYAGQVEIDADVTELRTPGTSGEPAGSLVSSLVDSWSARAAGEGRWTPTATAPGAHDLDALASTRAELREHDVTEGEPIARGEGGVERQHEGGGRAGEGAAPA